MIEHILHDHTPLDVEFRGDPADRAELESMLEGLGMRLAGSVRQTPGPTEAPARSPERMRRVFPSPARLVVDQGPEYKSADVDCALAHLRVDGNSGSRFIPR